jgi:RNA-directed DNA polymerase
MADAKSPPDWLLRPLPLNATVERKAHQAIEKYCKKLPDNLESLQALLDKLSAQSGYDAAANHASQLLWPSVSKILNHPDKKYRNQLIKFVSTHMCEAAKARVLRRLSRDPSFVVRNKVRTVLQDDPIDEVALPLKPKGDWDSSGWLNSFKPGSLRKHKTGEKAQQKNGVPVLTTVKQLRTLLGIKTEKQLRYYLVASETDGGPYTKFTIPKQNGKPRPIHAPKFGLRRVQRKILDLILSRVAPHAAAHGFVPGRSTVTNAAQHVGAKLILKFDLTDFFPTIHYFRVVGLFTSLGYAVGDGIFQSRDRKEQVAPTLARLCCHTSNIANWGDARCPQGAPTSPAISNLVCRRLDARLQGLAEGQEGTYTRYADDLTFSFRKAEVDVGRFRWWVDQICHQEGFLVNQAKFRVIRSSQRQLVTGIVVNEVLRVPRDERRKFRAILHQCQLNGVESQARGRENFEEYLRGYAAYLHMVHPEEGRELMEQVNRLLGPETEPEGEG